MLGKVHNGGKEMNTKELPGPYIDCVIEDDDGCKRIGRLNQSMSHWQIASYQIRKVEVVWPLEKVVKWSIIDIV